MPYLPSMTEHEVSMRELFVTPKIVYKGQKQIRCFADFLESDGKRCKHIFLVGEPGSGKSTFIQYFALQWSKLHLLPSRDCSGDYHLEDGFQDEETLRTIEFLFYISLRDANHYCSYERIIQDQLLQHIYTPGEQKRACCIVQSVLESPTTCIASDGLDEWTHPTQGLCHCPSKIKGRTPVICQPHSATIVTTSRPWRLTQLPPMESKIEKRMDIEGTGNVDELGMKIVNVLNKEADEQLDYTTFIQCVEEQNVKHLLQTPILLLQLVCLFFDGKGIPNSQCKIYASIIDMLIGRKSQQHLQGRPVHQTTLQVFCDMMNIRKHWNHFIDIAKVAFEQLFPKHGHAAVLFNSTSCNLSEESKTFARECGLLTEKKSKSFSSRLSHLSFTHKSFQEFFAAIFLSEHEELFETVIEPRYQPCGNDEYRICMNDLKQIFLFIAGVSAKLAEKVSILMNSHLATLDLEELSYEFSSFFMMHPPSRDLTRLMASGLREADSNGLHDIKLCLHYVNLWMSTGENVDRCRRLLLMNKAQLVSLSVQCSNFRNKEEHVNLNVFTDVVSIQTCTQLRHLTLRQVDLGEHGLVLPDNITHVKLYNVTMNRGLSVQHYTHLQHLTLWGIKFDDDVPQLPISITHLALIDVTMTVGLSVQHYTQLQHLTLWDIKFDNDFPQLPISITHIELNNVTMTGGLSVQHFKQLQHLRLEDMKFDDDFPQLPNSITNIELKWVTLPVRGVLGLLEHLENLPHAVACELNACAVEPYSEHEQVEHRLKTSTSLQLDGYNGELEYVIRKPQRFIRKTGGLKFKCWKNE